MELVTVHQMLNAIILTLTELSKKALKKVDSEDEHNKGIHHRCIRSDAYRMWQQKVDWTERTCSDKDKISTLWSLEFTRRCQKSDSKITGSPQRNDRSRRTNYRAHSSKSTLSPAKHETAAMAVTIRITNFWEARCSKFDRVATPQIGGPDTRRILNFEFFF